MRFIADVRKHLRPIKRLLDIARIKLVELPYAFKVSPLDLPEWLIKTEVIYGGFVTDVARNKVSPVDPRSPDQLAFGGMTGGDRMLHNGYAPVYGRFLKPFFVQSDLNIAEFGILKGTGLAIWCDLFPQARVFGLDIDLGHYERHRVELLRRGAFRKNSPQVFEFDQLTHDDERLNAILQGETLDIVIDDGLHSLDSILRTWRAVRPHLSPRFVYFIEDFPGLLEKSGDEFIHLDSESFGMITVISAGIR